MPKMKPMILTRDAAQKEVFGAGYPSLPSMTVNEWYNDMEARNKFAKPLVQFNAIIFKKSNVFLEQYPHCFPVFTCLIGNYVFRPSPPPVDETIEKTSGEEEQERRDKMAWDEYKDG